MKLEQDLHEADTFGLRFETHNDALDYGKKVTKDANDWLAVHNVNVADRYVSGDLGIELVFHAFAESTNYHLVFCAVPDRHSQLGRTALDGTCEVQNATRLNGYRS